MTRICSPACILPIVLLSTVMLAQNQPAPSRPRPAPHITGTFIDADATGRLRLTYPHHTKFETFVGTIQSTCMLPADSKSHESKAVNLSAIPVGTQLTVYYVRHNVGKELQNVILAIRFDLVEGQGSTLPIGAYIACAKPTQTPASK